jgi:sulfoquinovosidase
MLHFPDNKAVRSINDQFMLGGNILMAPIFNKGLSSRNVILPGPTTWTHLWTGELYFVDSDFEQISVKCELGYPAVFYRDTEEYVISTYLAPYTNPLM